MKTEKKQDDSKTEHSKGNFLRILLSVFFLAITVGCGLYLGNYFLKTKHSQDKIADLKKLIAEDVVESQDESEIEFVDVNGRMVQKKYAALYESNPDFIGWITIPDTKVDYPVMQHPGENEYYINRNFEQEWDSSGLPFLDLRCSYNGETDNMMIYGHNMKAGTMFSDIIKYNSRDFYEGHKTFTFHTIDGDGEYEVIAAFYSQIYPEEDTEHFHYYEFFDANSEEEFNTYVEQVKALTSYEIETDAQYGDTLITLSTCAYHTEDGRFAVVARKIDSHE